MNFLFLINILGFFVAAAFLVFFPIKFLIDLFGFILKIPARLVIYLIKVLYRPVIKIKAFFVSIEPERKNEPASP